MNKKDPFFFLGEQGLSNLGDNPGLRPDLRVSSRQRHRARHSPGTQRGEGRLCNDALVAHVVPLFFFALHIPFNYILWYDNIKYSSIVRVMFFGSSFPYDK